MTRPDPRRIKDFAPSVFDPRRAREAMLRIKNGIKPTPTYAGEVPKLLGEKVIFAHRTEVA